MSKARNPAYFAVARALDDHRLFANERHPLSRKEAFLWLIKAAAWKPKAQRLSHGMAELERGQVAVTIRGLALAWRWPRWRVEYFFKLLKVEGAVTCAVIPTKIQTKILTKQSYRATVVTICEYNKYQGSLKGEKAASDISFRRNEREVPPQLPGFAPVITANHNKPEESVESSSNYEGRLNSANCGDNSSRLGKGRLAGSSKPPHGARNRKAQVRWFDYGTEEWKEAAEFDRTYRGVETFPRRYADGGRGNWFKERSREEWQDWGRRLSASGRR